MPTVGDMVRQVQQRLGPVDPAPREALTLVAFAMGEPHADMRLRGDEVFLAEGVPVLEALVARRLTGCPLAYVVGFAPFWNEDWQVSEGVLIPRPDTEILLQTVLEILPLGQPARVVEVGVGSGCVVGSVLQERPDVRAVGTDLSKVALACAAANWQRVGVADRVEPLLTDVLTEVEGPFDGIFSNPPYITDAEWENLEPCVRDFEPKTALTGDMPNHDGLAIYRVLLHQGLPLLKKGGFLAVEIGAEQGASLVGMLRAHGMHHVRVVTDLAGRDRVVTGIHL